MCEKGFGCILVTGQLLQPRPPNKILFKFTRKKIKGVSNKYQTSKQSEQATHYIINTFVIIFIFFNPQTLLVNLQRICLRGLGWNSGTVKEKFVGITKCWEFFIFFIFLWEACYESFLLGEGKLKEKFLFKPSGPSGQRLSQFP